MCENVEFSWRQISRCFHIKFPGLALAWIAITTGTLIRIIFLPPLIHNAADIGELMFYIFFFTMCIALAEIVELTR